MGNVASTVSCKLTFFRGDQSGCFHLVWNFSLNPAFILIVEAHQHIPEIKMLQILLKMILVKGAQGQRRQSQLNILSLNTNSRRGTSTVLGSFVGTVGRNRTKPIKFIHSLLLSSSYFSGQHLGGRKLLNNHCINTTGDRYEPYEEN